MRCYVGIDLGSTTTKAVYLDEEERILGRGITNSRSNYDVACQIAREEADIASRFGLLNRRIAADPSLSAVQEDLLVNLNCNYRQAQHLKQLQALESECHAEVASRDKNDPVVIKMKQLLPVVFNAMEKEAEKIFAPGSKPRSDFFRDVAASCYHEQAETCTGDDAKVFDQLIGVFDKCILKVEGRSYANAFAEYMKYAAAKVVQQPRFKPFQDSILKVTTEIAEIDFEILCTIGTGYGRQRLPFPKEQIRSEILCHGLGAHHMFPNTRTVLDIGGQDTKAIQIDEKGIVTNFQMNDRCAAGCGRYLGYIADEMNMGVHELGPMAVKSTKTVKINSTCTVFAGTELRERLALDEKRKDILAGLHRAIILRAMSLLARSGGIESEFTFTGGVAKNPAATKALGVLIEENYGKMKINISPDSIFTGALGAAIFAKRLDRGEMKPVELPTAKKVAAQIS